MRSAQRLGGEQGVALVFVLIMLSVMTMIGLGITGIGMVATTVTVNAGETAGALAIADAGLSHARRLILWQEWTSLNVFLQNAGGVACDGDELSAVPAGAPAGYPALASDLIPAAGVAFGGGTYQVFVCDDHVTDTDPTTGLPDLNPNNDANRRILVRSIGVGANGATATVEQLFGTTDLPAVIVNGNTLVTGNPDFMGAAGAIHSNGSMDLAGNPCAQQYYSSTDTIGIGGGSVGGGAGCTSGGVDARPGSPPINLPIINPDTYKPQVTFWMESNGTCYSGATGLAIVCPAGWSFNAGSTTWSSNTQLAAGSYWVNGNVIQEGSPGSSAVPRPVTILAKGYIDIGGSPSTTPALTVNGLGANPVGLTAVAGTDVRIRGNHSGFNGLYYANHQLDVTGGSTIAGQLLALNAADTTYPIGANAGANLVQLNAAGQMVISGNPTINFSGSGVQGLAALRWRECRTGANVADPCGPLFGL
ncbi:MAG TPA: hypothetical protein VMN81_09340 [Vicinamibacterales bacterium]|nr:hypothetical protein [Vicinamibacterales bacterium]